MSIQFLETAEHVPDGLSRGASGHYPKRRFAKGMAALVLLGLLVGGSSLLYRRFVLLPQAQEQAQTQTVGVETATLPITVAANGTVEPEQLTNVSPKTSERLDSVTVAEGDAVEAGQIWPTWMILTCRDS